MTSQNKDKRPARRASGRRSVDISVGDISGGTGIAIGLGAKAVVSQSAGAASDQIALAFRALQHSLEQMPDGPQKETAAKAVQELEKEARKGDQADASKAEKWLNFLAEIAPDVGEVAVDTFINPVKGVGTVFRKIAERAKADRASRVPAKT